MFRALGCGACVRAAALLLACGAALPWARAQSAPPPGVEDCVQQALATPARRTLAAAALQAWTERERSARAGRRPNVHVQAGGSFAPVSGYDPALTDGGEVGARVGIEQALFDGGRTRGEQGIARAGAAQVRAEQIVADADLALEVRMAFIDHWALMQRIHVLAAAESTLRVEYDTSARLARGGTAMRSDVLRLGAQLESEHAELAAARAGLRAAHARLAVAMGLAPDSLGAVEDTLRLRALAPAWDAVRAVDVVQAEQSARTAQAEADARRSDGAPRLAFAGDTGAWSSVERWRDQGFDSSLGYQVGISLEVPLWDGGARAGQQSAADAEVRARRAAGQIAARQAWGADQAERAAAGAAAERARGLQKAAELAASAAELVHVRWAGGNASGIEVLEAHRAKTEFALGRVDAEADAARAHARCLRAGGGMP